LIILRKKLELFKRYLKKINYSDGYSQRLSQLPRTSTDPEFTVEVQSVEGELTSRHYDLILDDDVVGKENSSTGDQIKKVINYYTQSLQLLKKPDGERLVIGTLWDFADLHNHILEKLIKHFDVLVRSIWKNDRYLRQENGEYKWVSLGQKEPIYPAMLDMEGIEELRQEIIADPMQGMSTWMAQYELKIVDDNTAAFKRKVAENEKFYFTDEDLYDIPLAFSLTLDPATGEAKQADDSAFTVRALDQEGYWYLVEVFGAIKMDEDQIADKFIELLMKYPIELCTIEGIAFARVYKSIIEKKCKDQKVYFPYYPLPAGHNNANKTTSDLKILGLSSFYKTNKIRFRRGCEYTEKLLDQLWRFPKAPHDDYPDSLSMHLHLPLSPSKIWRTKEPIIITDKTIGRYGEKIEDKKGKRLYQ